MPTSATLPPVSVVVPSRGRPEQLVRTVESILDGAEVPAELIVVDQSDAPTASLTQTATTTPYDLHYRWAPSRGVSRARNAGIAAASHDILAFVDDDVLVTRTWFGALIRAALHYGPRTVVTGKVLPVPTDDPDGFVPSTMSDPLPAMYSGRTREDVLYSGNMAAFRSAFDEVGLFDERLGPGARFPAAEDNDLAFRLLEAKYRIAYAPEAVLYHAAQYGRAQLPDLRWRYGYGQGAFYAKHVGLRDRHMLGRLGHDLRVEIRNFGRAGWGQRRLGTEHAVYAAALVAGASRWLLDARGQPARRRMSSTGTAGSAGATSSRAKKTLNP